MLGVPWVDCYWRSDPLVAGTIQRLRGRYNIDLSREDAGSDLAGDLSSGVAGGRDGDMVAAMIPPKQVAATTKANGHAEVRAAELDQPLSRCTPRSEPKPRPVVAPAEQQLEVVLHRRGGGLGLGPRPPAFPAPLSWCPPPPHSPNSPPRPFPLSWLPAVNTSFSHVWQG